MMSLPLLHSFRASIAGATLRLACTLVAAGLPASSALAADVRYDEAQSAITIEGSIAAGDELRFDELLDRRPTRLVIRSDGGAQLPSIAIARGLKAHRMDVIVDGFCASACAQIIFPAADQRRIRPGSFLAFHGGNLAVLRAAREAMAREEAALSAATREAHAASGPVDAAVARDTGTAHRDAVTRMLARTEAQFGEVDAVQAAFNADMSLDPAVVEFYQRLTSPRDIRIALHIDEGRPVEVTSARRAVCDWWIPDREGLARLGVTLRNGYDVPTVAFVALVTRSAPERLYVGPPVAVDDPAFETLCPPS